MKKQTKRGVIVSWYPHQNISGTYCIDCGMEKLMKEKGTVINAPASNLHERTICPTCKCWLIDYFPSKKSATSVTSERVLLLKIQ